MNRKTSFSYSLNRSNRFLDFERFNLPRCPFLFESSGGGHSGKGDATLYLISLPVLVYLVADSPRAALLYAPMFEQNHPCHMADLFQRACEARPTCRLPLQPIANLTNFLLRQTSLPIHPCCSIPCHFAIHSVLLHSTNGNLPPDLPIQLESDFAQHIGLPTTNIRHPVAMKRNAPATSGLSSHASCSHAGHSAYEVASILAEDHPHCSEPQPDVRDLSSNSKPEYLLRVAGNMSASIQGRPVCLQ